MTTSLIVAEKFGKEHKDVLKAIKNLGTSADFGERNFALSNYTTKQGKPAPYYNMTRDGFVFPVMGFTRDGSVFLVMGFHGKVPAAFKERGINEFNRM